MKTLIHIAIIVTLSITGIFAITMGIKAIVPKMVCYEAYWISVFGADLPAGTDYDKAKEMASGRPIYLRRYCERLEPNQ